MQRKCTALILAAGRSERMGRSKACLEMPGGKTFAEHIVKRYIDFGCAQIVMVGNKEAEDCIKKQGVKNYPGLKLVLNEHPEYGRNHSILLGLRECISDHPVFVHNVDNPAVHVDILEKMFQKKADNAWIKPVFHGKGGHPILLSPGLIQGIMTANRADIPFYKVLSVFDHKTVKVDNPAVIQNINTPQEYEDFLKQGLN